MAACLYCGTDITDSTARFCPKCGAAVTPTASTPSPSIPPSPATYGAPYPGNMPTMGYTSADTAALKKIKLFSLLGIIGIILGFIVPLATGFGFGSVFSSSGSVASALLVDGAVGIVGFIIGLISILQLRGAFKRLVMVDPGFSTPAKLVLGFFAGLALFIIAFIVIIAGVAGAIAANTSSVAYGAILGGLALIVLGGIAALIGIIGTILGLWRAGERYQESLMKWGGVFFIIPILDIVAPFMVYFGASNAEKKMPPTTTQM